VHEERTADRNGSHFGNGAVSDMKELCAFCFTKSLPSRKVRIDGAWLPVCKEHYDTYIQRILDSRKSERSV
jgi:hypothetical protein